MRVASGIFEVYSAKFYSTSYSSGVNKGTGVLESQETLYCTRKFKYSKVKSVESMENSTDKLVNTLIIDIPKDSVSLNILPNMVCLINSTKYNVVGIKPTERTSNIITITLQGEIKC